MGKRNWRAFSKSGLEEIIFSSTLGLTNRKCKVEQIGGILEIEYAENGELFMKGPSNFVFESEIDVSHIIGK